MTYHLDLWNIVYVGFSEKHFLTLMPFAQLIKISPFHKAGPVQAG
jgi:hypothetical protein